MCVPPSSQKRSLDLFSSRLRRYSFTRADPLRATTARSLDASLTGSTASDCLVNTTLPSRNGGRESWTSSVTRISSSCP